MTTRERTLFWVAFLAIAGVTLYWLRDVLLPFVAGMAVAYLLDPVVDRVERWRVGPARLGRTGSTLFVLMVFFSLMLGVLLLLVPLVQAQAISLSEALPRYIQRLETEMAPLLERFSQHVDGQEAAAKIPEIAGRALGWITSLLGQVISGGLFIANLISLLVITPIVSFYLLRDWDHIVSAIDGWLPRAQAGTIREQAALIDRTLAAFVRGQGTVCLVLGVFYAVGLSLSGLDFGLVIGLFAGLISFIPFVGTILGGLMSVGLSLAQFDTLQPVVIVAAIFVVGQVIEGNFLTPNLVGEAVGLHPVWVIFALLAGGALFGFVGVLLAVPVAAVIGVVTRFGLQKYLDSPLHLHGIPPPDDEVPAERDDRT